MIIQNQEWFYRDRSGANKRVTQQELAELYKSGIVTNDTPVANVHGPGIFFRFEDINARYQYKRLGEMHSINTDAELVELFDNGEITNETQIWGRLAPYGGIRFGDLQLIRIKIAPTVETFFAQRLDKRTTVLSGPNNSGKSLLLKLLRQETGPASTLLSTNRVYQLEYLNLSSPENLEAKQNQQYLDYNRRILTSNQNSEENDFALPEALSRMADKDRNDIFRICSELLGEEFRIEFLDKENTEMGPRYIEVGGISLSKASTGTRMLILLVTALMDKRVSTVIIDEPEHGLSPSIQRSLAARLFDPEWRNATFPHLRQIFLSTHSSFFLDRNEITNNFTVTKSSAGIEITQISNFVEFNNLQFKLLGNDFESIFLPSCILIVEGPSDFTYFSQLIENSFPNRRISVVKAYGDGGVLARLRQLADSLGDLRKSPFGQRILVVLDKKNSTSQTEIQKFGIQPEHTVILDQNGIEYYYPLEILSQVFGTTDLNNLVLTGSQIELNGITKKKVELAQEVAKKLTAESQVHEEIKDKILKKIRNILN